MILKTQSPSPLINFQTTHPGFVMLTTRSVDNIFYQKIGIFNGRVTGLQQQHIPTSASHQLSITMKGFMLSILNCFEIIEKIVYDRTKQLLMIMFISIMSLKSL